MSTTANNLMGIDSLDLIRDTNVQPNVGDVIHCKSALITGFGSTLIVTKVTQKQVVAEIDSLWFPTFQDTAFGRIANAENKDKVKWLKDTEQMVKGNEVRFWKETGIEVGGDRAIVKVFK